MSCAPRLSSRPISRSTRDSSLLRGTGVAAALGTLGAAAGAALTRLARYSSTPPGSAATVPSPMSEAVDGRDPLEEVAVVADDDERAGPAVEQVLERVERVDVEVVGRLVEQDDVGLAHEQPQDLQPAALAAGQVADARPLRVAGEAEAVGQRRGADGLAAAEVDDLGDLLDGLEHAQRRVELGDLLREVRGLDRLADDDAAAVGLLLRRRAA